MKTTRKSGNFGGKIFFAGVIIVVLIVILWLAVSRVLNLQTTIERPRADASFSCNDSSPDKVKSCFKDTGSCSGCWGYYNGGAYPKKSGGGGGGNTSCFDNCFKNIKPGNGSYCKTYCAENPDDTQDITKTACFSDCFSNIKPGNGSYCKTYCTDKLASHLECITGTNGPVCTKVAGAGTSTCSGAGTSCGTVVPNQVNACWGNLGADGKCYDCNGDGTINILDFSCFAKHWLENIGTI